jgi:uncharacterized membrane protein (DUF106 family)
MREGARESKMFEFFEVVIVIGTSIAVYVAITPKKFVEKKLEKSEAEKNETQNSEAEKESDFYGIKKFQNEPENFLSSI